MNLLSLPTCLFGVQRARAGEDEAFELLAKPVHPVQLLKTLKEA